MQVVILCGGKGTRLSEYTEEIPKPLVAVGNKPILHHLMGFYSRAGHKDFILCLGHKGKKIEDHFKQNKDIDKDWNISYLHTGEDSNKAERLLKSKDYIKDGTFLVSYGDDLSDVDINKVIEFHKRSNKIVTLTAIPLTSPFGILDVNANDEIVGFKEKPKLDHLMNGGFFVMDKKIFEYLKSGFDLEKETFELLAKDKKISAFKHFGFWKSMNTLKDAIELNEMYKQGKAPWIK